MTARPRTLTIAIALLIGATFSITTGLLLDAPSPSANPASSAASAPKPDAPTPQDARSSAAPSAPDAPDPLGASEAARPTADHLPSPTLPSPRTQPPTRPTLPAQATAPTAPSAALPSARVVDSATALGVRGRAPESLADTFAPDVGQVWAWVRVANDAPVATSVTLVWRHGEGEQARVPLAVGPRAPGWRTWSSKHIAPHQTGPWAVDVLDAQGHLLHTLRFTIAAPSALNL